MVRLADAMSQEDELRVAVDARCLNTDHVRGMGKYLREVISRADALERIDWQFFGDRPDKPFCLPDVRRSATTRFEFKGYRFHSWEQIGLPWRVRRATRRGVLHAAQTSLPWWQPVPTVVTLHDTIPWQSAHPGPYENWYWNRLLPAALARCAVVITISEASRRDILALWPNLESKLHVVRHGIEEMYIGLSPGPRPAAVSRLIGDRRYLLFVGGISHHKRFEWALRVFERLASDDLRLLALGFTASEVEPVRSQLPSGIADRIHFLPYVADQEMPHVYQHAVATLYPTRYEGFGFPVLESQAVGTPILFSHVGSLAELAGPFAEMVPPDDLQAWVSRLDRIIASKARDLQAANAARAWVQQFSWTRSAQQHLEIYRLARDQASVQ